MEGEGEGEGGGGRGRRERLKDTVEVVLVEYRKDANFFFVRGPMLYNFYVCNVCNKLECLYPIKPFQLSLMFASKAVAYLSEAR
jgi:hypothetical protein